MNNTNDALNNIFGMGFMDDMHDYPNQTSNIRYYHRLKARIINSFIQRNYGFDKTFLDAGAGRGPYCVIASALFKKVYCDEFDTAELAVAETYIKGKNMKNVEFLHNDLTSTSYADNSIHTAVCSEVLEHIPERQKAANELYRILKPGGKLLLSMPQKNSIFYRHVMKVQKDLLAQPEPTDTNDLLWHHMQHVKFSSNDIEKIATNAGFTVITRYGANVLPVGEKIFSKLYAIPFVFNIYVYAEFLLEKIFPRFASFYFIELQK